MRLAWRLSEVGSGINIHPVPFYFEGTALRLVAYDLLANEVQHLVALLHRQAGMFLPMLQVGNIDASHHVAAAEFKVERKNRFRAFVVDVSATAIVGVPDFPGADALEARPNASEKTQDGGKRKWVEGGHF